MTKWKLRHEENEEEEEEEEEQEDKADDQDAADDEDEADEEDDEDEAYVRRLGLGRIGEWTPWCWRCGAA